MTDKKTLPAVRTYCGAKKRQGEGTCTQPAGWGTDHVGFGRCKLHAGRSQIKSGLYSIVKRASLRSIAEKMAAVEDPLNLLPELAQLRAHYVDFIDRYDENQDALMAWYETTRPDYKPITDDGVARKPAPRPTEVLDLADSVRILSEISKVVKRIEDVRAQNAISRKELRSLLDALLTCVEMALEKHLDGELADTIKEDVARRWREVRRAR